MEQEQRRSSDVIIKVLLDEIRSMKDHMDKREEDANAWRAKFDERLKPLEELVQRLNTPFKIFTWGIGAVFVAILTKIGFAMWEWFYKHFH